MDYSIFKRIVEEATQFGARSMSLHLFGEPLLCEYIEEAVKFIKQCNRNHTILLTTNGDYLDKHIGIIKSVDKILWTSNGARIPKEAYKKLTVRLFKEIHSKEEVEKWTKLSKVELRSLHNYGGEIDLSKWNVQSVIKRYPCYHPWFAPAVAANGDILVCCSDPKHETKLGNIQNTSLTKVWQSEEMSNVRTNHLKGNYLEICKRCDVWKTHRNIW
ncbi:SPASM domain-containing protein [Patescibacteria group bacterium]|nr:SPASM domain-containing protein [Patescibacteria group bacterium]